MGFAGAVTLVIATFADKRHDDRGFHALVALRAASGAGRAVAPFRSPTSSRRVFGLVVVAAGAATDPVKDGGNFLTLLTGHGVLLSTLAVMFVFANLGSVCTHCLYNGAVGWSHLTRSRMRRADADARNHRWHPRRRGGLELVPGLAEPARHPGAADRCRDSSQTSLSSAASRAPIPTAPFAGRPFAGWAAGAAAALLVHVGVPGPGEAITGMVFGGVAFAFLDRLATAPAVAPT